MPTRLGLQAEEEGLGEHEHFMLKEIFEQPARLRDTVNQGSATDQAFRRQRGSAVPQGGVRANSRLWYELSRGFGRAALD